MTKTIRRGLLTAIAVMSAAVPVAAGSGSAVAAEAQQPAVSGGVTATEAFEAVGSSQVTAVEAALAEMHSYAGEAGVSCEETSRSAWRKFVPDPYGPSLWTARIVAECTTAESDVTLGTDGGLLTVLPDPLHRGYVKIAPADKAEAAETFTLVTFRNDEVALKSKLSGKFVMADLSQTGTAGPTYHLRAASDTVGPWEKFTIEKSGDATVLKSNASGKYVYDSNGTLTAHGGLDHALKLRISEAG
ncbi:hypothetical protein [Streptomyces sp. NPDC096030]|uniref:fascin domain-containing protein n=1 Tax=Streptomyces sp. NPDC096030 TaxID=3155423 RepID=UPI00331A694B